MTVITATITAGLERLYKKFWPMVLGDFMVFDDSPERGAFNIESLEG